MIAAPGNIMVMRQDKQTLLKEQITALVKLVEGLQKRLRFIDSVKAREEFLQKDVTREVFHKYLERYEKKDCSI